MRLAWMISGTILVLAIGCDPERDREHDPGESIDGAESGGGIVLYERVPQEVLIALATAECQVLLDCPCRVPLWADLESCVARRMAELTPLADLRAGQWNQDCADAKVVALRAACFPDELDHCEASQCALFVGSHEEGQLCADGTKPVDVSSCRDGKRCFEGRCETYCQIFEGDCHDRTSPGQRCELGTSCVCGGDYYVSCWCSAGPAPNCGLIDCPAPNICFGEGCAYVPPPGEPCLQGHCDFDGYCEAGTCVPRLDLGETCTDSGQCRTSLCVDNLCSVPVGEGEPCEKSCGDGLECDYNTGLCAARQPIVCEQGDARCATKGNGICEEIVAGGTCPDRSDDYDCGVCPSFWLDTGTCDEPRTCPVGTDTPDCG